jgi:hypothetical protein
MPNIPTFRMIVPNRRLRGKVFPVLVFLLLSPKNEVTSRQAFPASR